MREPEIPSDPDILPCNVCLKEIPVSEALNEEAVDYVLHFCGLECYAKWEKHRNEEIDAGITSGLLQAVCENNKRP